MCILGCFTFTTLKQNWSKTAQNLIIETCAWKNDGFAYCVLFAYAKHLGILLIITSNLHLIQNSWFYSRAVSLPASSRSAIGWRFSSGPIRAQYSPTATIPDSTFPDISPQMLFSMSLPHICWYSWNTAKDIMNKRYWHHLICIISE